MRSRRIDSLLQRIALLIILVASWGSVSAASISCAYTESGSGIGGTGINGSGIGGTGAVAKGTGIGGTGIRQETEVDRTQRAGNVTLSQGTVKAQSKGRSRFLGNGDSVCVGETIVTSQSGKAQIRMADGGLIAIRPQTELKIEKYVYRGTKKDESLLSLLKGACRFITGNIGKRYPQNDLVKTPTVIIGIRGTDHEAAVILPSESGSYSSGTYDKVNQGITFIRSERGEVEIHPGQVGFAESAGELPTILKDMPAFYMATPPMEHEVSSSKEGGKEAGLENAESSKPNDSERSESTDRHEQSKSPESHEMPMSPEAHERPEPPGVHELPGSPETPEMPEFPDLPESPEFPDLPESPE